MGVFSVGASFFLGGGGGPPPVQQDHGVLMIRALFLDVLCHGHVDCGGVLRSDQLLPMELLSRAFEEHRRGVWFTYSLFHSMRRR